MRDPIERQAAINILRKHEKSLMQRYANKMTDKDSRERGIVDGIAFAIEDLDVLPSAQPGWTPCNNAFPEEKLYVLVAYAPIYGLPDIGITYYSSGTWHAPSGSTPRKVIAWQKLPNPPKLDKKDGNGNE